MAHLLHRFSVDVELVFQKMPVDWTIGWAKPFRQSPKNSIWREMTMTIESPKEHLGKHGYVLVTDLPGELQRELGSSSRRLSPKARDFEVEVVIGHIRPAGRWMDGPLPEPDVWSLRD